MKVSRTRSPLSCALITAGLVSLAPILAVQAATGDDLDPATAAAISSLEAATGGQLDYSLSNATGNVDFVRATNGAVLALDNATASPEARALSFLNAQAGLFGIGAQHGSIANHSEFEVAKVTTDTIGQTHVRLNQRYEGLEVFGGQLVVHMNDRGITGVNGTFIQGIDNVEAQVTADEAAAAALTAVKATTTGVIEANQLLIYPVGLFEGNFEAGRLAWAVSVAGSNFQQRVFIDALTGVKLGQVSGRHEALHRIVYSPEYDPNDPNTNVRREEGDPPAIAPPAVDRLYDFAGQVYELFDNGFGRDSYDGNGAIMRSVYLVNDVCPNAYWNSASTNYCPGFDTDDIVAHEWGHAYTEKTHGLIYSYQSGALNESYSDIFGEIIDLNNGMDNPLSANQLSGTPADPNNNDDPYPAGQRWVIGEDLVVADQAQNSLLTRDMWDPDRLGSPGKVTSSNYACGTGDGGGVHTNSGVPNHAFAMLVDGQTYNGQTVEGIGFNRAAHIYYRAMTQYQVPSSNFAHHAESLLASCEDLRVSAVGLNDLFTGDASGETITQNDCDQLANAIVAVEMRTPPTQCGYVPMLDKNTPPLCEGATSFFTEDFEDAQGFSDLSSWTPASNGVNSEWPDFNWEAVDSLPGDRAGSAAFAVDSRGGSCAPGGDISGAFSIDSPQVLVPAGSVSSQVRFDHYVETELEFDGGNLSVSVNGGAFVLLDESQYIFNGPNGELSSSADGNTNPKAGELAWHGADGGEVTGSWGTTIVDLNGLASGGDTVVLRYDFGVDGCNGVTGWYVDNVNAYTCTDDGQPLPTAAPTQLPITDDAEPDQAGGVDQDGNYTISWTYPDEEAQAASCGFRVEEATSFGNLFQDDGTGLGTKFSGDPQWYTATHPDTGDNGYSVLYLDSSNATLTQVVAIELDANETAVLSFDSFEDIEDGYDQGIVQISVNGGPLELLDIYTGEFSGRREVSLGAYAGQSVQVAFTLASDLIFSTPQYQGWFIDNIAINSADWTEVGTVSSATRSLDIEGRADGSYYYRVVSLFGSNCDDPAEQLISNERSIVVERDTVQTLPPTASFTATPDMAEVGESVMFDGSASFDNDGVGTEPQITSYRWSFGDGATETTGGPVTNHTYAEAGIYEVRLTVTDNEGQIDSADAFVDVEDADSDADSDSEKVKGSGYIIVGGDGDSDSDSDSDSDRKAKFSFNTKIKKGVLSGKLKYEDKLNAIKVKADSISNRFVTGNDVTISAPCSVNKVEGYTCTVYASDNDGSGGVDTFAIHVSGYDYQAGGELAKGDIKIY